MSVDFTLLASGFELFVAGREDFVVAAVEAIERGEIANRTVKTDGIIMADKGGHDPFSILQAERSFGADGLLFQGAMEAFELAVALRVVG